MNARTILKFLVINLILVVFMAGCVAAEAITAEAAPSRSNEFDLTQSAQAQPTPAPQPTAIPTQALPPMKEYKYSSNSFSISVPANWNSLENNGYVLFTAPDQSAAVEFLAENTGNALDAEAFNRVIDAYEFNIFSPFKNYKETKREVQADKGYAIITKALDVNAISYQVSTIYQQKGKVVYIESYYTTVSGVDKSGQIFTAMHNSFKTEPANAEGLSPFTSAPFTYTDPDNLYRLLIPSLWTYDDVNKNGSMITFTSPDANADIILVKKDLGKIVTRALADSNALDQLKVFASDARVSKKEDLKNSSLKITWAPKSGGLKGLSIYKWSGTTWFFLTWKAKDDFEGIYGPVFKQSIDSYELPQ